jgi:hypothetical protein
MSNFPSRNCYQRTRTGDLDNHVFSSKCHSLDATCSSSFSGLLLTVGQRGENWGPSNTSDTLSGVEEDEASQVSFKCPVVMAGCHSLSTFNTESNQAQIDFPPRLTILIETVACSFIPSKRMQQYRLKMEHYCSFPIPPSSSQSRTFSNFVA